MRTSRALERPPFKHNHRNGIVRKRAACDEDLPRPPSCQRRALSEVGRACKILNGLQCRVVASDSPPCLGEGGVENVDYNSHSPADTNASIVGSHFWVYVLQLPRAGQATYTPECFCWTRTLAIVGKHVLQLCTPRHSYIYQARGVLLTTRPTFCLDRASASRNVRGLLCSLPLCGHHVHDMSGSHPCCPCLIFTAQRGVTSRHVGCSSSSAGTVMHGAKACHTMTAGQPYKIEFVTSSLARTGESSRSITLMQPHR